MAAIRCETTNGYVHLFCMIHLARYTKYRWRMDFYSKDNICWQSSDFNTYAEAEYFLIVNGHLSSGHTEEYLL